jgi:DNA-binding MarR family transcriptional regulator
MQDPTSTDPRPEVFGSLFVIVQHLTRRLDDALVPLGLTSRQWLLLAVLQRWFADHHPSLTEAAGRYGTSRQNVKQVALGLERQGYLRLILDPADRRTTRLVVTDKVRIFDEPEIAARGEVLLRAAFAELDPAELAQLHGLVVPWLLRLGSAAAVTPDPAIPESPTAPAHRDRATNMTDQPTRPSSTRSSLP